MAITLTTTGIFSPVIIQDFGGRQFNHPTSNLDLLQEFSIDEIRRSVDVFDAVVNGYIIIKDSEGNIVTSENLQYLEVFDEKTLVANESQSSLAKTLIVDEGGSDSIGLGTFEKPYKTISYANSIAVSGDVIKVMSGTYIESNPIICKNSVSIIGDGGINNTIVYASNPNANIFEVASQHSLIGMTLIGATNKAGIYQAHANGYFTFQNIVILNCKYGVHCNNTTSGVTGQSLFGVTTGTSTIDSLLYCEAGKLECIQPYVSQQSKITNVINCNGSIAKIKVSTLVTASVNVTNAVVSNNGGYVEILSSIIDDATLGFKIGSDGTNSKIKVFNCYIEDCVKDLEILSTDGIFRGSNVGISRDKFTSNSPNVWGFGLSEFDNIFRSARDFAVGLDSMGANAYFGEGGEYKQSVMCTTWNGTTFVDKNIFTDNISFPNLSTNSAIYFGDYHGHPFYSLKYYLTTAINLGSGSLVWEYFDGGVNGWVVFDVFVRPSGYSNSLVNNAFSSTTNTKFTISFDYRIKSGVVESNANATGLVATTINSRSASWVRCRIASTITTSPVFSDLYLEGNSKGIRHNGSERSSGESRGRVTSSLGYGDVQGTADAGTINVSSNINYQLLEAKLNDGKTDSLYTRFIIPSNCDTSCGLSINLSIFGVHSGTGIKTAKLHLYSSLTKQGTILNGTNPQSVIDFDFITPSDDAQSKIYKLSLPKRINIASFSPLDVMHIVLTRLTNESGDNKGDVTVQMVSVTYTIWENGQNLL
jgi:hypothetical protein